MRNYDLSPLYRATVGYDHVADLIDRVLRTDATQPSYPPYNIEKTGEDAYRISIAVAGFGPDDLSVEVKEKSLIIAARKAEDGAEKTNYLHRGIATRAFERRFHLADHLKVTGAGHDNGLLHIDLVREVPEALKPRQIVINGPATIDAKPAK